MLLAGGAYGDGHYWFVSHAIWSGITVADFMFPWFVFIMGTSIHLSINILLSKGQSYPSIYKKLVSRSITLFIMGVCIQPHNDFRTLRIPGVLQRFGITYFIVSSSYLLSRRLQARRTERTVRSIIKSSLTSHFIDSLVLLTSISSSQNTFKTLSQLRRTFTSWQSLSNRYQDPPSFNLTATP
eukprot:XP_001180412.2 PREDICTED: heparan-alpha-glucosaminide N-acetyltransferase [Strongylocentrotus purpuratus]